MFRVAVLRGRTRRRRPISSVGIGVTNARSGSSATTSSPCWASTARRRKTGRARSGAAAAPAHSAMGRISAHPRENGTSPRRMRLPGLWHGKGRPSAAIMNALRLHQAAFHQVPGHPGEAGG
eukprot:6098350-Prorocentrum_lima.AAC.1